MKSSHRSHRRHSVAREPRFEKTIGRVGALAVVLGVGMSLGTPLGCGIAHATEPDSTASNSGESGGQTAAGLQPSSSPSDSGSGAGSSGSGAGQTAQEPADTETDTSEQSPTDPSEPEDAPQVNPDSTTTPDIDDSAVTDDQTLIADPRTGDDDQIPAPITGNDSEPATPDVEDTAAATNRSPDPSAATAQAENTAQVGADDTTDQLAVNPADSQQPAEATLDDQGVPGTELVALALSANAADTLPALADSAEVQQPVTTDTPNPAPVTLKSMVTDVLTWLGLRALAPLQPVPDLPVPTIIAGLWQGVRDFQRRYNNQRAIAEPATSGQDPDGTIGGSLNATDFEGDPLTYTIATAPNGGTVALDTAGNFIYTPGLQLATAGGTDSFTVAIIDTDSAGTPLRHGLFDPGPFTATVALTVTPVPPPSNHTPTRAAAATVAPGTAVGYAGYMAPSGRMITGYDMQVAYAYGVRVLNFKTDGIVVGASPTPGYTSRWQRVAVSYQLQQFVNRSWTTVQTQTLYGNVLGAGRITFGGFAFGSRPSPTRFESVSYRIVHLVTWSDYYSGAGLAVRLLIPSKTSDTGCHVIYGTKCRNYSDGIVMSF